MYMYIQVVLQSNQYCSDINLLATEAADRAAQTTLKVRVHLQFILYICMCIHIHTVEDTKKLTFRNSRTIVLRFHWLLITVAIVF